MATVASQLHHAIDKVCPIDGVSIGDMDDRATWLFHPKPDATEAQVLAAVAVLKAFAPNDEAQLQVPQEESATLRDVARMAEELAKAKAEIAKINSDMQAFVQAAVAAAVGAKS